MWRKYFFVLVILEILYAFTPDDLVWIPCVLSGIMVGALQGQRKITITVSGLLVILFALTRLANAHLLAIPLTGITTAFGGFLFLSAYLISLRISGIIHRESRRY